MQQDDLNHRLKERDMPEIIDWWRQEGIEIGMERGLEKGVQSNKLESARKLREHGVSWEIVTDVTGLKPEDLA
jgi:predicted transposase/invertase (TIGR01784 family)